MAAALPAAAQDTQQNPQQDTRPPLAPDIREDETNLKVQRGNFVAVPIPISRIRRGCICSHSAKANRFSSRRFCRAALSS